MEEREGGFIKIHRRIESWDLWRHLRADQRMVVVTLLLMANWKDSHAWAGKKRFEVKRGQVLASYSTIAKRAGTTIQVVRTTVALLRAAGFLNTEPNTHKSLLTISNYCRYQDAPDASNTASNTRLTRGQHAPNTRSTPSEEGEEEEEHEEREEEDLRVPSISDVERQMAIPVPFEAQPPDRKRTRTARAKRNSPTKADSEWHQTIAAVCDAYQAEIGSKYPFGGRDANALRELKGFGSREEIVARWRTALQRDSYPKTRTLSELKSNWAHFAPGAERNGLIPPTSIDEWKAIAGQVWRPT